MVVCTTTSPDFVPEVIMYVQARTGASEGDGVRGGGKAMLVVFTYQKNMIDS